MQVHENHWQSLLLGLFKKEARRKGISWTQRELADFSRGLFVRKGPFMSSERRNKILKDEKKEARA